MNSASHQESVLLAAFRQQQSVFENASQFLDGMMTDIDAAAPISAIVMEDLHRWLQRIGAAQQEASNARTVFEQSGLKLSPTGRREVAERELMLRKFQGTVDHVLNALQNCRSALVPHLDSDVRRRSMHSAYQKSLRTC